MLRLTIPLHPPPAQPSPTTLQFSQQLYPPGSRERMSLAATMPILGWKQRHRWGQRVQLAPGQGLPGGIYPQCPPLLLLVAAVSLRPPSRGVGWLGTQDTGLHHLHMPCRAIHRHILSNPTLPEPEPGRGALHVDRVVGGGEGSPWSGYWFFNVPNPQP
jgi:hypothetical protein